MQNTRILTHPLRLGRTSDKTSDSAGLQWPARFADDKWVSSPSRSAASWLRAPVTIISVLLVVTFEFVLLTVVYQRTAPLRSQRIVVSELAGELRTAKAADVALVRRDASQALDRLSELGLSRSELAPLRTAAAGATASGVKFQELSSSVNALSKTLSNRQRTIDLQAELIYVAGLAAASVGWMGWFRRLVARQRGLQAQVSEQQARAESEQRLAALVRNSSDAVLVCDLDASVSFVTPSIAAVLGLTPEQVVGRRVIDLVDDADRDVFVRLLTTLHAGEDRSLSLRMHHADGRMLNVEGTITNLLGDAAVGGLVVTIRDVTDRVQLERQLTHQAFHDSLTQLANRQLFSDRLSHALARRGANLPPLVVLFCDLDEFKNVNDSLGHGVGDQVLVEIAKRAAASVRAGDTVARLGGDEFAILLEDANLALGQAIAERLLEAIAEPIEVDGSILTVRVSIGMAAARPGELSGEDVLRNADVAMYLAKDRGKGMIAVYESRLHAEALDRLAFRADLQRAIRQDELVLHYQPTVDLTTGRVAGFEALVRWNHPEHGLIPPADFITVAEETGLIHSLGSWVLRVACRAAVELYGNAPASEKMTMAVNVASQQLGRSDFVDEVFAVLAETGLKPQQLTLEITESVLVQDVEVIIERLARLRSAGIRIAIDDFGTGYSSLAYLRELPVDVLKVDKAFIDRVMTDRNDAALTEAILAMSASMSLLTVAEGVEDDAQAGWLTAARCRYGQGYLWSRPVPLELARELVLRRMIATPAPPAQLPPPRDGNHDESRVIT